MLSMGISELNHMIDHALASGLNPGDISAMSYAYRLITFLLGVLMVPLTTVMFSKMSRLAAAKDKKGMLDVLRRCVLVIALVALPIVAVAVVLRVDVIKFAYMRGRFDMHSVQVTAGILMCYVVGVPAFGLRDFLNRVFHALQDTATPFRVSCVVVVTNIVLNLILRVFLGAKGLALATSIAGATGMVILLLALKKRFRLPGLQAHTARSREDRRRDAGLRGGMRPHEPRPARGHGHRQGVPAACPKRRSFAARLHSVLSGHAHQRLYGIRQGHRQGTEAVIREWGIV